MPVRMNLMAAAAIVLAAAAPGAVWAQAADAPATPAENEAAPAEEPAPAGDPAAPPADGADAAEGQSPAANETAPPSEAADGLGTLFADMGIDVSAAGTMPADAQSFFEGLTAEQQQAVAQHCAEADLGPVPQAAAEAEDPAATFCRNLVEAGVVEDPTAG